MRRYRSGLFLCAVATVLGTLAAGAAPRSADAATGPPWFAGELVGHVDVDAPLVALTFDDGPRDPETGEILDVLREQGVHATFFLVGENVRRHPDLARRIVREGHAIGNHSWSHPSMGSLSRQQAWEQIARTDRIIEEVTGVHTTLFRPPYGDAAGQVGGPRGVAGLQGHLLILWSVEVRDWSVHSARRVAVGTLRSVRPGSIVLLHDGGGDREHTVTATRWMVAHLSSRGYRMVTLPELLAAGR